MKEGIFNQTVEMKTVLSGCINGFKTISSPMKIYNPVISRKPKHFVQLQIHASRASVLY